MKIASHVQFLLFTATSGCRSISAYIAARIRAERPRNCFWIPIISN